MRIALDAMGSDAGATPLVEGAVKAAKRLDAAVAAVIAEGKNVTYDMKPHRDDPTAVGTMLEQHLDEKQDFGLPLFNLLSVMIFLDQCRSRAAGHPARQRNRPARGPYVCRLLPGRQF